MLAASPFVGPYARKVYRKAQARLRQEHGIRTSMRRPLRLMREHGLLAQQRSTTVPVLGLVLVDHRTGAFLAVRVALRGTRYETEAPKATDCLRETIWATKGRHDVGVAHGVALRHDHGSQFVSHAFQDELRTVGIASSPSFVRQPEGHGCVERFIRTLKEQLPLLRRFATVTELEAAPREFQRRFNHHWNIGRLGYRTPARHRRILLGEAA